MNDDITSKIEQLKDMLNNGQLSDNLKNMMSLLSGSNDNSNEATNNSQSLNDTDKYTLIIAKVKKIMDKKSQINDPRINLLHAIKPYLNSRRQERIDNCVKILDFVILSKILKEEDF